MSLYLNAISSTSLNSSVCIGPSGKNQHPDYWSYPITKEHDQAQFKSINPRGPLPTFTYGVYICAFLLTPKY